MKISIIIPVFNSGRYLSSCLDSVLSQSMGDFEVLCVDDASTDDTAGILKSYAQTDQRIKVFTHEVNSGPGASRNRGLGEAVGDYILAVDGDDLLYPDALKKLYEKALRNNSQAVAGGLMHIAPEGTPCGKFAVDRAYDGVNPADYPELYLFAMGYHTMILFKRDLVHGSKARYRENVKNAEDGFFLFGIFFHISNMTFIPDIVYLYRQSGGSLTRTRRDPEWYVNDFAAYAHLYACAIKHDKLSVADIRFGYRFMNFLAHDLPELFTTAGRDECFSAFDSLGRLIRRYKIHERNFLERCMVGQSVPLRKVMVPGKILQRLLLSFAQNDPGAAIRTARSIWALETCADRTVPAGSRP